MADADIAITVVIIIGVFVGAGLVWGLLKASEKPDPALVVTSLSLITVTSLIGYGITRLEIMGGLAATGVGALAGAIAGLYQKPDQNTPPEKVPNDEDNDCVG